MDLGNPYWRQNSALDHVHFQFWGEKLQISRQFQQIPAKKITVQSRFFEPSRGTKLVWKIGAFNKLRVNFSELFCQMSKKLLRTFHNWVRIIQGSKNRNPLLVIFFFSNGFPCKNITCSEKRLSHAVLRCWSFKSKLCPQGIPQHAGYWASR